MSTRFHICLLALSVWPALTGRSAEPDPRRAAALTEIARLGGIVRPTAGADDALEVDLQHTIAPLSDQDLLHLAALPNIAKLQLKKQPISSAGVAHLKKLSHLRELHLEETGVTDAAAADLAELPNLTYLNLYGAAITDAGLEKLRGHRTLQRLYVGGTQVTEAGIERLKQANPSLRVVPDPAVDRSRARVILDHTSRTRAEAETSLAAAIKDAAELPPRADELKQAAQVAKGLADAARQRAEEEKKNFDAANQRAENAKRQAKEAQDRAKAASNDESLQARSEELQAAAAQARDALEAVKKSWDEAKTRAGELQQAEGLARRMADRAANAKKVAAEAQTHLETYQRLEREARESWAALGGKEEP